MPKVSVEIPQHIIDDINRHIGPDKKFLNFSEAVRSALRKMLDQLDEIDRRAGRLRTGNPDKARNKTAKQ
ncbi:MAG: ribbon-helix-helix domain-containing protein [Candidatus Hodarchaeales archaeon]